MTKKRKRSNAFFVRNSVKSSRRIDRLSYLEFYNLHHDYSPPPRLQNSQLLNADERFDWTSIPGLDDLLPLICSSLTRQDVQNLYCCNKQLRLLIKQHQKAICDKIQWKQPHMKQESHFHNCNNISLLGETITGTMIDGVRHGEWKSERLTIHYYFGAIHNDNDQPGKV